MRSQDTTDVRPVVFPFWMVQEIALDLVEKSALESREKLIFLELSGYREMVFNLEKMNSNKDLQLQLLRKENTLLESRLELAARGRTESNWMLRFLQLLGAVSAGYLIGKL